jgi:hypothetical protein
MYDTVQLLLAIFITNKLQFGGGKRTGRVSADRKACT